MGHWGKNPIFTNPLAIMRRGVSVEAARAPEGWQARCYPLESPNTNGIIGHCMHPADLFLAKAMAGRPKDVPFLDAMIEHGLVQEKTIQHLIPKIPGCTPQELKNLAESVSARFRKVLLRQDPQKRGRGSGIDDE